MKREIKQLRSDWINNTTEQRFKMLEEKLNEIIELQNEILDWISEYDDSLATPWRGRD